MNARDLILADLRVMKDSLQMTQIELKCKGEEALAHKVQALVQMSQDIHADIVRTLKSDA